MQERLTGNLLYVGSEARAESVKPHHSNLKRGCNSDYEKPCVIKQVGFFAF